MTLLIAVDMTPQSSAAKSKETDVSQVANPLFSAYCASCHSDTKKTAGLALDHFSASSVSENPAQWEKVLLRLRARRDPPVGSMRPDEKTYLATVSALESGLDQAYPEIKVDSANRISDADLATRMAKFIWNDTPDAALLQAAKKGTLKNPQEIDRQVRRMLKDPKSESLVRTFFERWASVDLLENSKNVDETLRRDLETETRMFLADQLREDHNALDLWTANYTFLNDRLAHHYGIAGNFGTEFRRFTYTDDRRGGLLGQGSFLTVSSYKDRTSPVSRGRIVVTQFFGTAPPPPIPNVPPLPASSRPMRVRMQEHLKTAAVCSTCHASFEPLGYALENFNPLGQWRDTDFGESLDVSGAFVDGSSFNGPAELRSGLLKYRAAYYSNITQKLFGYALGRDGKAWTVKGNEMPEVRSIVREAGTHDYRWSSIVAGIVKSAPFQIKSD
jgi:hypothetical protein